MTAPVTIPPPNTIRLAALLVAAESVTLVVLGIMTLTSGLSHDANVAQLIAQTIYYVILGAALGLVVQGLLRGRRWARSPAIVAQVVVIAIGMWVAFPSDQLRWGLIVIAVGAAALGLLISPTSNHWIKQFPRPFGLDQDR